MAHNTLYYEEYQERLKAAGIAPPLGERLWNALSRTFNHGDFHEDHLQRFNVEDILAVTPKKFQESHATGPTIRKAYAALQDNLKKNPTTHNPLKDCTWQGLRLFAASKGRDRRAGMLAWREICHHSPKDTPTLDSLAITAAVIKDEPKQKFPVYEQLILEWFEYLNS